MASSNEAVFSISLEDETSGAASSAASALEDLEQQISRDTKSLREMQAAMRRLNGASTVNVKAGSALNQKIKEQKQRISEAQAAYVQLGGTFTRTRKHSESFTERMSRLSRETSNVPGGLSRVFGGVGKLAGGLSGGAVAALAMVGALAALAAAAVAAAAAIAKIGLAHADARRSELIHLEGITKLKFGYAGWINQMRGSADTASQLQGYVDEVSGSVALGRDKVLAYEQSLYKAGLRGDNLKAALQGISTIAAVQGEGEAQAFKGWALGAAYAGKSVRALADDVEARLGPLARRQMLSITVQAAKMRENFARLFDGLKLDGFLRALNTVTSLFSQSTATGRGLKELLTGLIDPIMRGFEALAPVAKRVFQGLVLGGLVVENAWLDLRLAIKSVFGDDILGDFGDMVGLAYAVAAGVVFLAGALAVAAIGAGLLAVALLLPVAALGLLVYGAYEAIKGLVELDWGAAASGIIDGIVNGIVRGREAVKNAIVGMGKEALQAFKDVWEIASPSKIATGLGLNISTSTAKGVDEGAPLAQAAVDSMIIAPDPASFRLSAANTNATTPAQTQSTPEPVALPSIAAPTPAANARSNRTTVSIGNITVQAPEGTNDPQDWARRLKDELSSLLEGVAVEMGAA